jgi:SAM-dependent MidA family methyltransferase
VTLLAEIIARRIRLTGPLTVADFMAEALGHPEHGYYRHGDPFGLAGDFITSPEISQMFGELLGAWAATVWEMMGRPQPVRLVELGPGRGTLLADALRGTRQVAGFHAATDVHLVEISRTLRERQKDALRRAAPELVPPSWHDDFTDAPEGPLLLLANEFFDALPVHQFQRAQGRWHERVVTLDESGGGFRLALAQPGPAFALAAPLPPVATEGAVIEVCPAGVALADAIARRVAVHGGAALLIDYGHDGETRGESLQAVRRHDKHDILVEPGTADLSAHVDFGLLARAAREAGAKAYGPVPQGALLERLGLHQRSEMLMRNATPAQAEDIMRSSRRLLDLAQMGTLFKALAIAAPNLPTPPGFE